MAKDTTEGTAYLYALELARKAGPDAIKALIKLIKSQDERIVLAAAVAVLDRGFGKPAQSVDLNLGGRLALEHAAVQATAGWLEGVTGGAAVGASAEPRPH